MTNTASDAGLGHRIRLLRNRTGLSVRQLSKLAGVTAAMISLVERGRNSPSVATLQKILSALGTDLASFFGQQDSAGTGPVFPRETMRLVMDPQRSYTIIFPRRKDVHVEMLDEQIRAGHKKPPFETLKCDVAGLIVSGLLVLEVDGQSASRLRPGDAFYLPKGTKHRGYAADEPVRLVTSYSPARY